MNLIKRIESQLVNKILLELTKIMNLIKRIERTDDASVAQAYPDNESHKEN